MNVSRLGGFVPFLLLREKTLWFNREKGEDERRKIVMKRMKWRGIDIGRGAQSRRGKNKK